MVIPFASSPMIAAAKKEDFQKAICSDVCAVFALTANIMNLSSLVAQAKSKGKIGILL